MGKYLKSRIKFFSIRILIVVSVFALFIKCEKDVFDIQTIEEISSVIPYQDIRWKDLRKIESQLDSAIIKTFWFNEKTIFPEQYAAYAKSIMDSCKNPGLGIYSLHKQGITGKGVAVAIIDQNICFDHPEFAGKIFEYYDVGCNQPSNSSSMHGPAVASLLVGDAIGTAPDAKLYFVAAPSWTQDAKYEADALNWIIQKNNTLPEGEKIKAVSVSGAPSGTGSPFIKNNSLWDSAYCKAVNAGILVIDCTSNNGITAPCYYNINDPDDISKCTIGYLGLENTSNTSKIYVPTSCRTTAEEYDQGQCSYQYTGRGGLSWAEPYLVGVLALGWQLRPDISGLEMINLLLNTTYLKNGAHIIQPKVFIDSVKLYNH